MIRKRLISMLSAIALMLSLFTLLPEGVLTVNATDYITVKTSGSPSNYYPGETAKTPSVSCSTSGFRISGTPYLERTPDGGSSWSSVSSGKFEDGYTYRIRFSVSGSFGANASQSADITFNGYGCGILSYSSTTCSCAYTIPKPVAVKFYMSGDTSTLYKTVYAAYGSSLGARMPDDPAKDTGAFKGWYTGSNSTFTKDTVVSKNTNVFSNWHNTTNVTIATEGPLSSFIVNDVCMNTTSYTDTYNIGDTITASTALVNGDKYFYAWKYATNGSSNFYDSSYDVDLNIKAGKLDSYVYKAVYSKPHNITVTNGTAYTTDGKKLTKAAEYYPIELVADEKENMVFDKWVVVSDDDAEENYWRYDEFDETKSSTSVTMGESDIVIKATYTSDGYIDSDGNMWKYEIINSDKVRITGAYLKTSDVIIPSEIEGHTVTEFGAELKNNMVIKTLTMPDTLEKLTSDHQFMGCTNLTKITFSKKLSKIPMATFNNCSSLTDMVNFADSPSITRIEDYAFGGCANLGYLVLPPKTSHVGDQAFGRCTSLRYVVFPDVAYLGFGYYPFMGCNNLNGVFIPASFNNFVDSTFQLQQFSNFVPYIFGYAGSPAEEYTKGNSIIFVDITKHNKNIGYSVSMEGGTFVYTNIKGKTTTPQTSASVAYIDPTKPITMTADDVPEGYAFNGYEITYKYTCTYKINSVSYTSNIYSRTVTQSPEENTFSAEMSDDEKRLVLPYIMARADAPRNFSVTGTIEVKAVFEKISRDLGTLTFDLSKTLSTTNDDPTLYHNIDTILHDNHPSNIFEALFENGADPYKYTFMVNIDKVDTFDVYISVKDGKLLVTRPEGASASGAYTLSLKDSTIAKFQESGEDYYSKLKVIFPSADTYEPADFGTMTLDFVYYSSHVINFYDEEKINRVKATLYALGKSGRIGTNGAAAFDMDKDGTYDIFFNDLYAVMASNQTVGGLTDAFVLTEKEIGYVKDYYRDFLGLTTPAKLKAAGAGYHGKLFANFPEITKYDLYVCGTQVTVANARDILGNGVFKYNAGMQTLTINGDYSSDSTLIQNTGIDGLVINVTDTSNLTSELSFLSAKANTTLTGQGKLTVDCKYAGIAINKDVTVTIKDADVSITATGVGGNLVISDNTRAGNRNNAIIFDNSNVYLESKTSAACAIIQDIEFNRCTIAEPVNGYIEKSNNNNYKSIVVKKDDNTSSFATVIRIEAQKYEKGDVNHDGSVSLLDVVFLSRAVSGVESFKNYLIPENSFDGNDDVTRLDVVLLSRRVSKGTWD